MALELYGVNKDIFKAIKYHTLGNINMNLLDKIIFIADKIESGKDYYGIEEERKLAYINIGDALILCLENSKKKLKDEGKELNDDSKRLLKYLYDRKR